MKRKMPPRKQPLEELPGKFNKPLDLHAPSIEEWSSKELLDHVIKWLEDIRTRWGDRLVLEGEEAWLIGYELNELKNYPLKILEDRLVYRHWEKGEIL
jgi:hypothetical protein